MDREKVLSKIEKLLNLAERNTNENEAALAAMQARNLMKKYDISESEVGELKQEECEVSEIAGSKNNYHKWEISLATVIEKLLPIKVILRQNRKGKKVAFIGQQLDIQVAMKMYEYLRMTIWRLSRKAYPGESGKILSFCLGATVTVYEKAKEIKAKEKVEEPIEEQKYEVICVNKDAKLRDYLEKLNLINTRQRRSGVDPEAYVNGLVQGKGISLNKQLH